MADQEGRLVGRDAFVGLAALFCATRTVRGTLGVAALPMHHPLSLPIAAATLSELSSRRFSLGLGVSHPEQCALFGADYPDHPVDYMRSWIKELKGRSASGVAHGGGWPVLIAALGPAMVALGAQEADGLILNWLTPQHAATTVRSIRESAPDDSTPRTSLYLRLMNGDALRADAQRYDAMSNYHRHFLRQGLTSREEIVAGTTLSRDDLGASRARLDEYREAGVDCVCIYPATWEPEDRMALKSLAS